MSPLDALHAAIGRGIIDCRRERTPGAIVRRMGAETREALQRLTSAEVQHPFHHEVVCELTPAQHAQEQLRALKLLFDRQLGLEA